MKKLIASAALALTMATPAMAETRIIKQFHAPTLMDMHCEFYSDDLAALEQQGFRVVGSAGNGYQYGCPYTGLIISR